MFSRMIEYLWHTACAARQRWLRQVLQALTKILLRLVVVKGRRTGLLAELLTRWVQEHRDMSVSGLLQAEKLLEPALPMRGFKQIGAPDNMSEMGLRIINGRGQLVGIKAVPALHNEIF